MLEFQEHNGEWTIEWKYQQCDSNRIKFENRKLKDNFVCFNFLLFIYLFFLLYNIVLVLPYINMNLPLVYTCSQSWTPLPPPSPHHPSGSSQCISPKLPVSCMEPGLDLFLIYYYTCLISSIYFFLIYKENHEEINKNFQIS